MIVIDGRESSLSLSNYANLEDMLVKIIEEEKLEDRIVTDVLVDDKAFSELYPHQAEDIEASEINRVEIRTVSLDQMAGDVVAELPKVIDIMAGGSRSAAALLRRAELAEGLEVLQDVIGVSRELLNTIYVLRSQYSSGPCMSLEEMSDTLGDLLGEIADVMSNEDWVLVADLLEYEYLPACEGWRKVIAAVEGDVLAAKKAA
ncbi:MAG: hypothetical protein LBR82_01160 [Desulfovibrio sp.]|nr:hypothetical protein [Desulfovibrio sp.]